MIISSKDGKKLGFFPRDDTCPIAYCIRIERMERDLTVHNPMTDAIRVQHFNAKHFKCGFQTNGLCKRIDMGKFKECG